VLLNFIRKARLPLLINHLCTGVLSSSPFPDLCINFRQYAETSSACPLSSKRGYLGSRMVLKGLVYERSSSSPPPLRT